jgi:hypothetical protein
MSVSDRTIRRLARSHTNHTKAIAAMSGAYIELLSVYTHLIGAVEEFHLDNKPLTPECVEALHNRAMASIESFRNGVQICRDNDEAEGN